MDDLYKMQHGSIFSYWGEFIPGISADMVMSKCASRGWRVEDLSTRGRKYVEFLSVGDLIAGCVVEGGLEQGMNAVRLSTLRSSNDQTIENFVKDLGLILLPMSSSKLQLLARADEQEGQILVDISLSEGVDIEKIWLGYQKSMMDMRWTQFRR